jgi:exosortase
MGVTPGKPLQHSARSAVAQSPIAAAPMSRRLPVAVAAALMAASFIALYYGVAAKLSHDWLHDDNYSHGFLIVPLALYFVWERRSVLARTPARPSAFGLVIVAGSLLVMAAGLLGAELFLTRISLIGCVAGMVLFLFGWRYVRLLAFPLAFLLLMVPLPAIIFNQIAFPLQLLASRVGVAGISAFGIPVLREGNVIVLANTSLEVAEACSGIRSLISLLTLGIVFGYFVDPRPRMRTLIALTTIPIAVFANGVRVAGTGIAAYYYGASAAEGFLHEFSGWLIFVVSFALLFAVQRALARLLPVKLAPAPLVVPTPGEVQA